MSPTEIEALAEELCSAHERCEIISAPPSARGIGFDLSSAYAVEADLVRMRRASGRTTVGWKVGYANKAVWRVLKLDTLVWAHMYDDTVRFAQGNRADFSVKQLCSAKIEPEIVFKLKRPLSGCVSDPAEALRAVEWLALGFEIIDCPFVDWKFQPSDFVAAYGLHAALIVGEPRPVESESIAALVEQLGQFKVSLSKDAEVVAAGSGRNSLRSPAMCLAELASAVSRQNGAEPLAARELISSGTLTESLPVAANQTWVAALEGLDLPDLTLHTTA